MKNNTELVKCKEDLIPIIKKFLKILNEGDDGKVIDRFSNFDYWYYLPTLGIFIPNKFLGYKKHGTDPFDNTTGMYGGKAREVLEKYFDYVEDDRKKELKKLLEEFLGKYGKKVKSGTKMGLEVGILVPTDEIHKYFETINFQVSCNGELTKENKQLMPVDKFDIISKAFKLMLPDLPTYIGNILEEKDENDWWQKYVISKLQDTVTRKNLPKSGQNKAYIKKLDISASLKVIISNWQDIFRHKMTGVKLSWIHELLEIRNEDSHWTIERIESCSNEDIIRALDTMGRFMRPINEDIAEKIFAIKNKFK